MSRAERPPPHPRCPADRTGHTAQGSRVLRRVREHVVLARTPTFRYVGMHEPKRRPGWTSVFKNSARVLRKNKQTVNITRPPSVRAVLWHPKPRRRAEGEPHRGCLARVLRRYKQYAPSIKRTKTSTRASFARNDVTRSGVFARAYSMRFKTRNAESPPATPANDRRVAAPNGRPSRVPSKTTNAIYLGQKSLDAFALG